MFLSVIKIIFESIKLTKSHQVNPRIIFLVKNHINNNCIFFHVKKIDSTCHVA
jgi:hypothetical protein